MKKEELNYTLILHQIRKKLKLSLMEYCLADSIYHLSNNPKNKVYGWCYASKNSISNFLGTTEKTIFENINRLIKKGLIERDEETKYLKTTQKWYDNVVVMRLKSEYNETSQGITKGYSKVCRKVIPDYNETSYYNNIDNNKNNNIRKEREEKPPSLSPKQKMELFIKDDTYLKEISKKISDKYSADENLIYNELIKFRDYWTELNPSGSKQRWQLQKTFEVDRRIKTWFSKAKEFSKKSGKEFVIV